jgi:hypothetical protein
VLDRYTSFQVVGDSIAPAGQRVPPNPEEAGWKDTARVPKGQMLRVIMRFGPDGYLGNYVFHCHMLEHEDNDMMRQFTVVPPARRGPRVATAAAEPSILWPPDLKMVPVNIVGVTDPTGAPVTIHVTSVTQDEPISHQASAGPMIPILPHVMSVHEGVGHRAMGGQNDDPCVDARVVDGQLFLRRERREGGNGLSREVRGRERGYQRGGGQRITVPARAGFGMPQRRVGLQLAGGCIVVRPPMDMTMARHSSGRGGPLWPHRARRR